MSDWDAEIRLAAERHGLEAGLVAAVVHVESSGNPFAWNPEPKYRYLWHVRAWTPFRALTPAENASEAPPADFPTLAGDRDQEWWAQQASWGLCQVMGAVAREHGFRGSYLTELTVPGVGLDFGCRVLARRLIWAKGDVRAALASYNGGPAGNVPGGVLRNAAYADRVLTVGKLFA